MAQNSHSLNEIAHNLLNTLRGGRTSHSEHISLEQIKFNIKYWRAVLLRRDMERNNNRFRAFEQDLGVVDVSTVDSAEHDTVDSGHNLIRTTKELPAPVRFKTWEGITHISDPDKFGLPIPIKETEHAYFNAFNKYTKDVPFATLLNGYIYIHNDLTINNLNIRGVFEDPEEVFNFTNTDGTVLYDEDAPFPISSDMVEQITRGLLNGNLSIMAQTKSDTEADTMQQ